MSREYGQNGTDKNVSSYGKSQSEVPCENSLENIKQYRRKAEIKRKLTAVAVLCAVVIVGAFLCYTKFFKIHKLVVKGDCPYTEVEMMEGMVIQKGETLYGKSDKEINQNVKYNLAFIDSMKISRIWPDTMKVTVEKAKPTFCISIENTMYILSQSLRVLSKTENIEDVELNGLVYTELGGIKSCVEGEFLVADEASMEILLELYDLLNEYEVFSEISGIDLTDRFDINMTYGTKFVVKLGDKINLEPKIQFMLTIINEKKNDGASGIIDVSDDEVKEGTFENFT